MHSFLIAACFIAIVLSPCVAAQFTGTLRLWERPEPPARLPDAETIADPLPPAVLLKRAVQLECVRSSRLRRIHLAAAGGRTKISSLGGVR